MDLVGMLEEPARRASLEARAMVALARAGVIGIDSPQRILGIVNAIRDYGPFGGAPRISAIRHGDCPAITDEIGTITFAELDERVNRLANALRSRGLGPGSSVGILSRNHRGPLITAFAASRSGMTAIWLNTSFSPRQAKEVADREGVELLIHDAEFADMVAKIEPEHGRIVCMTDDREEDELDRLIAQGDAKPPPAPEKPGRIVLLTSGTSGTPKGAPRAEPRGFIVPGSLLERMPMRAREANVIAPPLFHGTGLIIALLSVSLGSNTVLRRRFDAKTFLADIERNRATGVCVVPVMLQRVIALGEEEVGRHDLSSLRVVFCAGSALPAEVALKATELFGDVIYNLYGSTEVAVATLATPKDVREAPTSVGKPALGSRVKIYDKEGHELPTGEQGRIFVGTSMPFEGYTGGGQKDIIDGLLSTGDIGHIGEDGRLYIDGRDDDMIVSGGENVFPGEVEELLVTHKAIADAAAFGVEDEDFGQRLKAYVVLKEGQDGVSEDEVKKFVKDNLANYKVPRQVVFIDELPRNPTGKILKRELKERED
jgi:fatty-acyl-CoA synthase